MTFISKFRQLSFSKKIQFLGLIVTALGIIVTAFIGLLHRDSVNQKADVKNSSGTTIIQGSGNIINLPNSQKSPSPTTSKTIPIDKQQRAKSAASHEKDNSTSKAQADQPLDKLQPAVKQNDAKKHIDFLNVYQYGQLIFTTDKPYEITGDTLVFDKLLIKGQPNYNAPFLYAGTEIIIVKIEEAIGQLISGSSVEGPLLRGVTCKVIRK